MSGVVTIRPADLPTYLGEGGRRTRILLDPATGHPGLELYQVELPPQGASEFHARTYPEVLIVTSGVVGVDTHDRVHTARAGEMLLIPAGVEHRHVNAGGDRAVFVGIFAPPSGHADSVRSRPMLGPPSERRQ